MPCSKLVNCVMVWLEPWLNAPLVSARNISAGHCGRTDCGRTHCGRTHPSVPTDSAGIKAFENEFMYPRSSPMSIEGC
ncbi:hypothetical protein DFH11DRAFT_1614637 [Phellopilus nigrolimitatus]|nr:hypothetical protein DFH11DRAFT_1614637 [Phellopilus nigrolimitatus]